jgi:magnesium-transporting ATPase (P-type)
MNEPPKRRDEPILNRYMIDQIVVSGGLTVAAYIFFLLSPYVTSCFRYSHDKIYLLTAFFALFIFTSVLHCFNCRTDRVRLFSRLTKNKAFIFIMLLVCTVQIAFIYLGGPVLRTAPLTWEELRLTLLLALPVIPIDILRKLLWRLRKKHSRF